MSPKTILTFVHLASFALSFGLVLFCDLVMAKVPLKGRVSAREIDLLRSLSTVIWRSLVVLIFSGIGFLVFYYFFEPQALANPKLYAKMVIVTVLSINGYWLHNKGLKYLEHGQHTDLRGLEGRSYLRKLLLSGGVSALSWWSAFALGTFRELNFAVSFQAILFVYAAAACLLVVGTEVFLWSAGRLARWPRGDQGAWAAVNKAALRGLPCVAKTS